MRSYKLTFLVHRVRGGNTQAIGSQNILFKTPSFKCSLKEKITRVAEADLLVHEGIDNLESVLLDSLLED